MDTTKQTILTIEDNAPLARALNRKLEDEGYAVLSAADGQAGLDLALEAKPDLILLDVMMPVMDGKEMLARLRRDTWGSTVPVILLSNDDNPETINETVNRTGGKMLTEMNDYLIKSDISLEQIVEAVRAKLAPKNA